MFDIFVDYVGLYLESATNKNNFKKKLLVLCPKMLNNSTEMKKSRIFLVRHLPYSSDSLPCFSNRIPNWTEAKLFLFRHSYFISAFILILANKFMIRLSDLWA